MLAGQGDGAYAIPGHLPHGGGPHLNRADCEGAGAVTDDMLVRSR